MTPIRQFDNNSNAKNDYVNHLMTKIKFVIFFFDEVNPNYYR